MSKKQKPQTDAPRTVKARPMEYEVVRVPLARPYGQQKRRITATTRTPKKEG